jgi:hypothetical protein
MQNTHEFREKSAFLRRRKTHLIAAFFLPISWSQGCLDGAEIPAAASLLMAVI